MAKPKQVTVGIERTINLGNYENVRYSVQVVTDIADTEDLEVVYQDKLAWCKEKVMAELTRLSNNVAKPKAGVSTGRYLE